MNRSLRALGQAVGIRSVPGWIVLAMWGCGSTTVVEPDPGSASSSTQASSSAGSGAGGNGGGGATATGGVGGGNGVDCNIVPELIDNLLEAAAACTPQDPEPHCQDIVDGYCCPVPVESISSPSTIAYLDFLELTKEKCPDLWEKCAVVDCAFPENVSCAPSATDPTMGLCTANP